MSKKLIIISAALGLVAFGATFGFSFMKSKKAALLAAEQLAKEQAVNKPLSEEELIARALGSKSTSLALTEKQLEGLIQDLRDIIRDYNNKTKDLNATEERVEIAQSKLKKDIEELTDLRTELATTTAALRQEHEKLLQTRIVITQSEQLNLTKIAATYDKMNATGAADIFISMSKLDTEKSTGINDVVKILYYMNDRTKAKILTELVNTEPKLAAMLSQELKRIQEVTQ